MYSYLQTVAILVLVGWATANRLPKPQEESLHDLWVEKLYDPDGPTDPGHTKMLLDNLVDHFATYYDDDHEHLLSEEGMTDRDLVNMLAGLDTPAVNKCNTKFFCDIETLMGSFTHASPALHEYVSDAKLRQTDFCVKFFDFKFLQKPLKCQVPA